MSAQLKLQQQPKSAPMDTEAEQNVLGAVFLENGTYYAAAALIGAADFYRDDHRVLWSAQTALAKAGKAIDYSTVVSWLRDRGELEAAGGMQYVGTLANDTPSAANVVAYAERVREMSQRRRVLQYAWRLAEQAYTTPAEELVGEISTGVTSLLSTASSTSKRFMDAVNAAELSIRTARARREAGGSVGAPTGLADLDRITGGFSGPRLILMAARPKCGKSALLNQFGLHAARNDWPGLIVSLELGADELAMRALANAGQLNVTKLHRGYDGMLDSAAEVAANVGDIPLWFDTETTKLESIIAQIALHKHKHGIRWAAVDHIGLIRTSQRFNSANDRLGHISWSLKELAKRLDMPIVALSQLSRKCDAENRRPRPDDLRDSGNIEQDADMVIMLHTPVNEREAKVKPVHIGVPANRIGPSLWLDTPYQFEGATQTFREGDVPPPSDEAGSHRPPFDPPPLDLDSDYARRHYLD